MKYGKSLLLLLLMGATTAFSQSNSDGKRDYQWITGWFGNQFECSRMIDFNNYPVTNNYFQNTLNFTHTAANICDTNGSLIFYTNGFFISDRDGNVMPHGDSLSYGLYYQSQVNNHMGQQTPQGVLILPLPKLPTVSENLYYIIYEKIADNGIMSNKLLLSIVNMEVNGGMGDVIVKNNIVLDDTIAMNGLTAVRHINNRDWWILIPIINTKIFYRYLLNPEGLHLDGQQEIGFLHKNGDYSTAFSPDGNKFAITAYCPELYSMPCIHPANIFAFDRNTGILSNTRDFTFYDSTIWINRISFSPNSELLYASMGTTIYQWNTEQTDIGSSKTNVATWDGFKWQNAPVGFGFCQIAPDGKIYMSSSSPYLHVIEYPDIQGIGCQVLQHAITLPHSVFPLPNFPNFRLGSNVGIGEINNSSIFQISAFPNPAIDNIQFDFEISNNQKSMQFEIEDIYGRNVFNDYIAPFQSIINFNVHHLSAGVYFAVLKNRNTIVGRTKFIVQHY